MHEVKEGWFEGFGGRYAPETLIKALDELWTNFNRLIQEENFLQEYMNI